MPLKPAVLMTKGTEALRSKSEWSVSNCRLGGIFKTENVSMGEIAAIRIAPTMPMIAITQFAVQTIAGKSSCRLPPRLCATRFVIARPHGVSCDYQFMRKRIGRMPVYCSIIFSFCRRSAARAYHQRARWRNNISKYCDGWQPCNAAKPTALVATVRLAAEFRNWHLIDRHWQRRRGRRLQLPHREHARRDRGDRWVIRGLVIRVAGRWRSAPRAIFFKISEHKIVLRQLTVTLAKFY